MCIMIHKFVSVAVYKIYQQNRLAKLREMEAPGLPDKFCIFQYFVFTLHCNIVILFFVLLFILSTKCVIINDD